jgi:hypothetical protein
VAVIDSMGCRHASDGVPAISFAALRVLTRILTVNNQAPFFIIGCARSGTTMLRDVLRADRKLVCPEETQYYRWGDPFGTNRFVNLVAKNATIRKHRAIDGIDEALFAGILREARSRRSLLLNYMEEFKRAKNAVDARWFDKSPQNIYGLPLLVHDFPEAAFIHIVRNPLNVSTSLLEGKVLAVPSIIAAANYWNEAVAIFNTLKPIIRDRCFELRYEDFTARPMEEAARLGGFLGIDVASLAANLKSIHPERDRYREVLTTADVRTISELCSKWAQHYGYSLTGD